VDRTNSCEISGLHRILKRPLNAHREISISVGDEDFVWVWRIWRIVSTILFVSLWVDLSVDFCKMFP